MAAVGLGIIVLNLLAAAFAPLIAPHDQTEMIGEIWAAPSAEAWLGLELEQRTPDQGHPLLAPRCRCAEPAIAEDFYGEQRCTFCGREPRR